MTQATSTGVTVGEQIRNSAAIGSALDSVVAEISALSGSITDVRPAMDGLKQPYEEYMAQIAEDRGRGLLYPYIGSGAGNGALVELQDGSVKWDMICGIGVQFFGHADADLIATALKSAAADTVMHGNLQSGREAFDFGHALVESARRSSKLAHVFLSPTGALANENALKVCYQKHAPASRALAFRDCFMGRTVTMCQIGDSAGGRVGVPLSTQIDYIPFFDASAANPQDSIDASLAALREVIHRYPKQHACFIFELIQGEGGFNTAPREFFVALMECCREHGIAVWSDEVQTFGRTGEMFAYELLDLGEYVDILSLGKMSQACATLYTERYNPKPGLLSGTFTSAGSAFAVGQRIIERLRDGGYYGPDGSIAAHHAAFREHAEALAARHPDWFPAVDGVPDNVGGVGGMCRMTPFGGDKNAVSKACRTCFDEGVVLFYCGHGPFHVRMLPPLGVMRIEDWPRVFECIERGFAKVATA